MNGVSLDEIQSHERTRIDYACLRGLVAIELKSLEGAPSERTNNFVDSLRDRPDFPTFFGSVPLEAAIKNMDNSEQLRRTAIDRVGRTIVTHMKKANDQLRQHALDFPRRTRLSLLVLVNEDHPEYDPQTVAWVAQREMSREVDGSPRYANIDAVLYLTERHGQSVAGKTAFPICAIHGPTIQRQPWKVEVLTHIFRKWASFHDRSLFMVGDKEPAFQTIEHIPDQMARHEMWRLEYRRKPYLKHLSDEQLREEFDEVMLVVSLWGIKGSPVDVSMDHAITAMERFTHIQIEMHARAIPMERFEFVSNRELAAAIRLKLPQIAIDWLNTMHNDRNAGTSELR